jgi:uncharacterized membrane protein
MSGSRRRSRGDRDGKTLEEKTFRGNADWRATAARCAVNGRGAWPAWVLVTLLVLAVVLLLPLGWMLCGGLFGGGMMGGRGGMMGGGMMGMHWLGLLGLALAVLLLVALIVVLVKALAAGRGAQNRPAAPLPPSEEGRGPR